MTPTDSAANLESKTDPKQTGSEALQKAKEAFDAGRYSEVRSLTADLVNDQNAEVARSAIALRRKTAIDPAQVTVLLICLAFFVWVVWKYVF